MLFFFVTSKELKFICWRMTSAGSLKKTKVGAGIFVLIVFRLWHGINVLKISKMFTLLSLMTVTPVRCLNVKCSQPGQAFKHVVPSWWH